MSYQVRILSGILLVLLNCLCFAQPVRIWKKLYMDKAQECENEIRNDNLEADDFYMVLSDEYGGRSLSPESVPRPAECTLIFNFGDRYVGAQLTHWGCGNISRSKKEQEYLKELYLAFYDVCDARRRPSNKLLAKVNCSDTSASVVNKIIKSAGSCLTIYHHRGHIHRGYYFVLEVIATDEIIPFPVGGIAGIIVGSFVITMILVKLVCAITGFDRRLPIINIDVEEQKRILESCTEPIKQVQTSSSNDTQVLAGPSTDRPNQALLLSADQGHRVLRLSKSSGSATSAEVSSEFDYDFLEAHERPPPTGLKRYPSVRASSIWRHK